MRRPRCHARSLRRRPGSDADDVRAAAAAATRRHVVRSRARRALRHERSRPRRETRIGRMRVETTADPAPNEAGSATANPPLKRNANAASTRRLTQGRHPPKMLPDALATSRTCLETVIPRTRRAAGRWHRKRPSRAIRIGRPRPRTRCRAHSERSRSDKPRADADQEEIGASADSMSDRYGSSHGGSLSPSPSWLTGSSAVKPGSRVASSNSTPPGSRK